jgi:hypothetical protein
MKRDNQYVITYQNQSDKSLRYFENLGIQPDLLDMCLTTDLMTEFAILGPTKEVLERFKTFQSYFDGKYRTTTDTNS